ncbi:hypothetical protein BEWA_006060 [Theileria equi strain WA]|uniref:Uncharacterized protein n=1 Tax=Theileria equi strain WA TaxID=1537102 RepID=L0B014_THEEQ|nr:hypothetical protein BEWA_006060 [Theileria equi strain WA]AFZ81197.1 hypothetical protein BEWA_006060 [Theileria equi strain WA]|eukprot:XP_004830863.1 hypothetical protein BEWA_006060 [Theileria equi strain WA]
MTDSEDSPKSSSKKKAQKKTAKPKAKAKETKPKAKKETKVKKETKTKKETKAKKEVKVKKEKEVKLEAGAFDKPGQKFVTPPQGDGTRGFYESLYQENPNSLIAIKFCVEYGIFGGQKHNEILDKYVALQKNGHLKGTVGAIKPGAVTFLEKLGSKHVK